MDEKTKSIIVRWSICILIAAILALGVSFKISTGNYNKDIDTVETENRRIGKLLADSEGKLNNITATINHGVTRIGDITERVNGSEERLSRNIDFLGNIEERLVNSGKGFAASISAIEASLAITTELASIVEQIEEILYTGVVD